ncbi:MAG TPA: NAD(P)/FAD-dependent oxidoreductase [Opitutaceae bacterium]|nr:NAD(P)/FAD-dependent oxidoreductase [Opitutaceae bacterium]
MNAESGKRLPHIVVLGAGFAGLSFCKKFPSHLARITVVDRQNHHLFQPLLYQVATAGLAAPDIAQPIRAILAKKPNLTVIMGEVKGIDLNQRKVTLDHSVLDYDYLLIGLGGVTSYFGHNEWERFAPGLKSLNDALLIRRRVLLSFEKAETEPDEAKRKELLTTVVVGGGPTGVELAGAVSELARTALRKDFDHIDPTRAHVVLVEGADRILLQFPPELSASGQRQLEKLGVEVRTSTRVQDIKENEIVFADGTSLRAGNILWGAGVGAVPLTKQLGVEVDRAGRIKVLPDCSIPGHPEAYAAGDIASLVDKNGKTVPGVSPAAMQMAEHAAKVIEAELTKGIKAPQERPAFGYWDKGSMATIGRSAAVAMVGKLRFSGLLAWLTWLGVHLIFLVGFRSRVSVFFAWVYSYFTYKRGARIIVGGPD